MGATRIDRQNRHLGPVIVEARPAPRLPSSEDRATGTRGLSTARAVLKVLSLMAQHPEGVSARDVAQALGKSISTAYDLLASLHEEGFARHEPGFGYRLNARPGLSSGPPERPNHGAVSGAVDQLFSRTRKRSYLAEVMAGAIVITAVRGRQGIPRVPGLGPRIARNAHAVAIGKVVLCLLPEHGRRRYIERGLGAFTANTIISPAALMSELARVRSDRCAVDRGEFDPEHCTVAAPVLDARGRFVAVLGLSTSSRTFDAEVRDLVGAVREVAGALTGSQPRTAPRRPPVCDAPTLRAA
jgi:DNA-binding IclR family transcriptional regulator